MRHHYGDDAPQPGPSSSPSVVVQVAAKRLVSIASLQSIGVLPINTDVEGVRRCFEGQAPIRVRKMVATTAMSAGRSAAIVPAAGRALSMAASPVSIRESIDSKTGSTVPDRIAGPATIQQLLAASVA